METLQKAQLAGIAIGKTIKNDPTTETELEQKQDKTELSKTATPEEKFLRNFYNAEKYMDDLKQGKITFDEAQAKFSDVFVE